MSDVLAVVSNYKRPRNVPPIVERLAQDGECDIIVADNAPQGDTLGDGLTPLPIIDVWRWSRNSGPPARWYPALAFSHQYRYVALIDDDHMPSRGLVKSLVAQAAALGDRFSVIGRIGRNFERVGGRWKYVKRNVRHGQVDMAGAGYFLSAKHLPQAILFRDELAAAGADPSMLWHDDILLNQGIQRATGFPSVMPEQPWSERRMSTRGYAFNETSAYRDVRDDLIQLCADLGWRPIQKGGERC